MNAFSKLSLILILTYSTDFRSSLLFRFFHIKNDIVTSVMVMVSLYFSCFIGNTWLQETRTVFIAERSSPKIVRFTMFCEIESRINSLIQLLTSN